MKAELWLEASGPQRLENTSLDYQKLPDKAVLRTAGPLGADFTVKVRGQPTLPLKQGLYIIYRRLPTRTFSVFLAPPTH